MSTTSSTNDTKEINLWDMSYETPQFPNFDTLMSTENNRVRETPIIVRPIQVIPVARRAFPVQWPTIRRAPQTASDEDPWPNTIDNNIVILDFVHIFDVTFLIFTLSFINCVFYFMFNCGTQFSGPPRYVRNPEMD
jgi:hypothetical protein